MLKDMVSNEADYKAAVGKSELKKRGVSAHIKTELRYQRAC